MNSVELWQIVIRKNPSFDADGQVTLSAKGLKKLFDLAYQKGYDHGFENGKAWEELNHRAMPGGPLNIFKDIFDK